VTTFAAYYDASGSQSDDGLLVVAGLVSTENKWIRFEREWDAVLSRFGVPYFHMKEFAPSTGPFAKWKNSTAHEERRGFLAALVKTIKHGIHKSFVTALMLDDFAQVNRQFKLREWYGGAYSCCASSCLAKIERWKAKDHRQDRILHIFEKGDCGQGQFLKFSRLAGISPCSKEKIDPATKRWFGPFQACDLLAWEYRRRIGASMVNGEFMFETAVPSRASFAAITRTLPYDAGIQRRAGLLSDCHKYPERFPPRMRI